jgi:serine/threonine protein kinase
MSEPRDNQKETIADADTACAAGEADGSGTSDGSGDVLLGTVFDGKYLIERLLGRGGLSAVYQALHQETDKRVAVKVPLRTVAIVLVALLVAVTLVEIFFATSYPPPSPVEVEEHQSEIGYRMEADRPRQEGEKSYLNNGRGK